MSNKQDNVVEYVGATRLLSIDADDHELCYLADGHWWTESFYLGTIQAREALFKVSSLL